MPHGYVTHTKEPYFNLLATFPIMLQLCFSLPVMFVLVDIACHIYSYTIQCK